MAGCGAQGSGKLQTKTRGWQEAGKEKSMESLYFIIMEVPERNPDLFVPPSQSSGDHTGLELKDYIINWFFELTQRPWPDCSPLLHTTLSVFFFFLSFVVMLC